MSDDLTYGDLFAGYAGLSMGLQSVLGGHTVWVSEIEKAPNQILATHYPDIPNLGDVTKVDWTQVEPVDVLCGGSPCQDLSNAGKLAGMKPGTRSGLWASMADAIAILKPALVVWENVKGALYATATSAVEPCPVCVGDDLPVTMRALGRVLGDLADLGYDALWYGLRAADVGGSHGRFRVFVFAVPAADPGRIRREVPAERILAAVQVARSDGEARRARRIADFRADRVKLLPTPAVNDMGEGKTLDWWDEWAPRQKSAAGRPAPHGKSLAIEAQRMLPTPVGTDAKGARNATRPYSGQHSGTTLSDMAKTLPTPMARESKGRSSRAREGGPCLTDEIRSLPTPRATRGGSATETERLLPTPQAHDAVQGKTPEQVEAMRERSGAGVTNLNETVDWGDYAHAIHRQEQCWGRTAPDPTEIGPNGPRLNPKFVEWMMGLPEGWVTEVGISRTQQLKALGNGVVPQQAAAAAASFLCDLRLLTENES